MNNSDRLIVMFEILEELSSAKGHRDHYKDLYEETVKALHIRTRQLTTAMDLLIGAEFSHGVLKTCPWCHHDPHTQHCAFAVLARDMERTREHGISAYDLDGFPLKKYNAEVE